MNQTIRLSPNPETLLLEGSANDYEYLNKSRREVDGIDDLEEWSLLKVSLSLAGGVLKSDDISRRMRSKSLASQRRSSLISSAS
jgi:hypothetical protein